MSWSKVGNFPDMCSAPKHFRHIHFYQPQLGQLLGNS